MICDNTHRLLYQYQSSPKLRMLALNLTSEYCSLEEVLLDLETRLDIDKSNGIQLDLIGEIVGQPRPTSVSINPDEVFGFDPIARGAGGFPSGPVPDFGWSRRDRADRGGVWTSVSGLFVAKMFDADYRTLLRARIYANGADGTVDSIVSFLNFAVGGMGNSIVNSTVGQVDLLVSRRVSSVEEQILMTLAPVAAGVRINALIQPTHMLRSGAYSTGAIGYDPPDGGIDPITYSSIPIQYLTHDPSNGRTFFRLQGGAQVPGVTSVTMRFMDGPSSVLTWNSGSLRYQTSSAQTSMTDYMRSKVGISTGLTLS